MSESNIDVQELLQSELGSSDNHSQESSNYVQALEHLRMNGTKLTNKQIQGMMILNMNGLSELSQYALDMKQYTTSKKDILKLTEKLTLADRVKGHVKMKDLMKNQTPSTDTIPRSDLEAQGLKESELR